MQSGDPIDVTLTYDATAATLTAVLTDFVTGAAFTQTYTGIDLATQVGGTTAYLGFTGADGGVSSIQTISNFDFDPASGSSVTGFGTNATGWSLLGNASVSTSSGNSMFNSGDPGLSGWTVNLVNSSNQVVTTTTDSGGGYSFSNIGPGTYTVEVVEQSGYVPSSPATLTVTAQSGTDLSNLNFGEFVPVTLSGEVFGDTNGDGVLNGAESGLAGWTVKLLNSSNQTVATTTTAPDGSYSFAGVGSDVYTIEVVQETGYVESTSVVRVATTSGQSVANLNVGEFQTVTISGQVFDDQTGDGVFGGTDSGVASWTVDLVNASNQVVSTTTASDGSFSFTGVGPGSFTVEEVLESGYAQTSSPSTFSVDTKSGQAVSGLSFGIFQLATASGELFDDANHDGSLDDGESGLSGWTVNLLNSSSQVVASTKTDANGDYSLTGIGPGTYTIQDALEPGYIQTAPSSGSITITSSSGARYSNENLGVFKAVSLAVSGLATVPSSGLQSSEKLVVMWTDTNTGTSAASGSFFDQIVITNTTTGDVLATSLVYYNAATLGNLASGASTLQQYDFALPYGSSGVGQIQFTVTADANSNVSTAYGEPNRTATLTETSTLAAYPDLTASGVSPSESSARFGDTLSVSWTVTNLGAASATGPWVDNVYLSPAPALGTGAIYLSSTTEENPGMLAPNASYMAQSTVKLPVSSWLAAGTYYLVVLVDAGDVVNESNTTTQESSASITLAVPPPPDLSVASVTSSLTHAQPGQSETVSWLVYNVGTGSAYGSWTDSAYLSPDGKLSDATLLGSVTRTDGLVPSSFYSDSITATLPASLADGSYQVIAVADSQDVVTNDANRADTEGTAPQPLIFGHVDLVPSITTATSSATSGTLLSVTWTTKNDGTAATLNGWVDQAYLSTTSQVTSSSLLLGTVQQSGPLAPGQSTTGSASATIPLGDSGTYQIIVVADSTNQQLEPGGTPNSVSRAVSITLAPYAVLSVSNVVAPLQTIGDPAYPTISWTVTNIGTGAGQTSTWVDEIIASPSNSVTDPNAVVLAEFAHTTGLAKNASYTQTQVVQMPPEFTGRYHLFVETDAGDAVFQNGQRGNDIGEDPNNFDVMPIPYADLVVSSITPPPTSGSGLTVNVSWKVTNQGIGLTSVPSWSDDLALASDPAGKNIIEDYGLFNHLGPIGPGGSYVRTASVTLPNGLSGNYYFVVTAAASDPPFEFIYGNGTDNVSVSSAFQITLTPPPDLTVTSVNAPTTAEEGSTIQVGWTVQNIGSGGADSPSADEVVLQLVGQPSSQFLILGTFDNFSSLGAGYSYSRTQTVMVPLHITGLYNVEVITNYDGSLFENGATANDTGIAPQPLSVTVTPRPDLQVSSIEIPATVDAGATFSVTYTITNQGSAPTTNNWDDDVYLSLTTYVTDASILIQDLPNQTALGPGDQYQATTVPVVVPDRFAGQVYVIVDADANHVVDQWPNGQFNLVYQPIYVNAIPLPDLVMSNVVAPDQEIAGSTFNVSYTVTNLGVGPTLVDTWTDSIWLTRDKTRPIPAQGDILLTQVTHSGALGVLAGYDQTLSVTLPDNLAQGTYYITPWTDLYSQVLQDELATNVNPDDPNNFENDNYKARAITILAPLPDLTVSSITAPKSAQGGNNVNISWTVSNIGNGPAQPTGWIDTVYLTNDPTNPLDQNAITMTLGSVTQNSVLNAGDSYNASLNVTLSPSAVGDYFVVYTDAPQPGESAGQFWVNEISYTNNLLAAATTVTPVPADLVVTNVSIPHGELLGRADDVLVHGRESGPVPGVVRYELLDRLHLVERAADLRPPGSLIPRPDDSCAEPTASARPELHGHVYGHPAPRHRRPVLSLHRSRRAQRPAPLPLHLRGAPGDHRLVAGRQRGQFVLARRVQYVGIREPLQQPNRHTV